MKLIANISLLFSELPFPQRIEAAAKAGFDGIEIQFPYVEDLDDIYSASKSCNMPVVLINLPAGNMENGDAGLAAIPERRDEFLQATELCLEWAGVLKVDKINILAGRSEGGLDDVRFAVLVKNLKMAGKYFAEINVAVQVEAINPFDMPGFLVPDLDTALEVLEATNHPNVQFQFDLYHMARTEHSLVGAIEKAGLRIGHVQFADNYGRHEPGTGSIDFGAAFHALQKVGYTGAVSAEYLARSGTSASLAWMPKFRKYLKD